MTQRQTILKKIGKLMDSVKEIAHVEVNKVSLPDIETVAFPVVFVFGGNQVISNRARLVGQKVWDWEVFVSFWKATLSPPSSVAPNTSVSSSTAFSDAHPSVTAADNKRFCRKQLKHSSK